MASTLSIRPPAPFPYPPLPSPPPGLDHKHRQDPLEVLDLDEANAIKVLQSLCPKLEGEYLRIVAEKCGYNSGVLR